MYQKNGGKYAEVCKVGAKFDRLTVIEQDTEKWGANVLCRCECGTVKLMSNSYLATGAIQSCGCKKRDMWRGENGMTMAQTTHGQSRKGKLTREYVMRRNAMVRAKRKGIPFDIELDDIVIPSHCPLLGIELSMNNTTHGHDSPSLDRIIPELGYVKGNVMVISYKANTMKNDSLFEEFERLYFNWKSLQEEV